MEVRKQVKQGIDIKKKLKKHKTPHQNGGSFQN